MFQSCMRPLFETFLTPTKIWGVMPMMNAKTRLCLHVNFQLFSSESDQNSNLSTEFNKSLHSQIE
jgi:hypothetical protein